MNMEELYQGKKLIDPADGTYDKVDGFLPDLFTMKDGSRVATKEDWKKRRQELLDLTVDLCFGGIPIGSLPAPKNALVPSNCNFLSPRPRENILF